MPSRSARRDDALGELRDVPGVFVFGSNDYWGPVIKNPLRYFLPNGGKKQLPRAAAAVARAAHRATTTAAGSTSTNRTGELTINGLQIAFAGVDDPHLGYDRLEEVAGPAPTGGGPSSRRHPRAVPAGARRLHPRRLRR